MSFTSTLIGKLIMTFLTAMVPVVELRGAIPVGVGMGLTPFVSFIVSVLGNMVPVPIVILFIRQILNFMKKAPNLRTLAEKIEGKAGKHEDKIKRYQSLGLLILVAIPLPGTGAYTGSLVASLFDIRLKTAVPVIFAGVVIAGIIVTIITYGFVLVI